MQTYEHRNHAENKDTIRQARNLEENKTKEKEVQKKIVVIELRVSLDFQI